MSRRLATLPLVTTSSTQATTTTVVPRPTTPRQLPRTDQPVVAVPETTTTTEVIAQEVPKSAYNIINALDALPVRDEHTIGYTRYRYGLWSDDNGDGCNTRDDVMIRAALQIVTRTNPCAIVSGDWRSPYDDLAVNDPDNMTVDHVVGLYEAWKSGAYNWTDAQRNQYLNDIHNVDVVLAISKAASSDKAGRDPKDWLPIESYQCRYLQTWVDVKTAWKLSVDAGERESIAAAALNC